MDSGRKTLYKPEYAEQAGRICAELGAMDKQLGVVFGVSERTINTWKNKHPEFLQSIKRGKNAYDTAYVEQKLLARALGYEYRETTRQRNEAGEMQAVKQVIKLALPDVTAQIFWLTNRDPDRWSRMTKRAHTGSINLIEDREPPQCFNGT